MTTAPTPSEAERLAMVLRSACALSHPRFGTDARFVEMLASQAQAIEKELLRLQAENASMRTTLEYVERWANHHGAKPHITAEQALGCIQHHPDIHDITKGYADGKRPNTFDPYARIAELEARKPLPLSVERLDELWASQRSFHGGEPLKMGHVEFARLIEVEYGVLGRIPIREENGGQIDHSLIARREVIADGPVRFTRLNLTEEGRAALTSAATGPLPGITGGSS